MSIKIVPYDIIGCSGTLSPDSILQEEVSPQSTHVISRKKNGDVLSTFSDNIWDFSNYTSRTHARLHFLGIFLKNDFEQNKFNSFAENIVKEAKVIVLNLWYRRQLSVNSLLSVWIQIKYISRYSFYNNISISEALNKKDFIVYRLSGSNNKYQEWSRLAALSNLNSHLVSLSHQVPYFKRYVSSDFIDLVAKMAWEREECRYKYRIQTPVIPIRILSALIEESNISCQRFLDIATNIETIINSYKSNIEKAKLGKISLGKWRNSKATLSKQAWKKTREELPDQYKLLDEFSFNSIQNIVHYISYIQKTSASMIAQFTGMRISEIRATPLNSYRVLTFGSESLCGFDSYTFKFSGHSPKSQFWVSSKESELYYRAALIGARLIYSLFYSINIDSVDKSKLPLFPSHFVKSNNDSPIFKVKPMELKGGWSVNDKYTSNKNSFVVKNKDMEEIKNINPWGDLSKKGIEIGKEFKFSWHMFRRSLVVYAARGGVSLPVITNQLKHTVEKMTIYYANESAYANNFVERSRNKNEGLFDFINELQEELLSSKIDLIHSDIQDYDGTLFGGAGVTLQKQKSENKLPSIYRDRVLTEKEVLSGRLAYRRTAVGGCSAIEPCNKIAFTSIFTCLDCNKAIFNDRTADIMLEQIEIWRDEIDKYGENSPFSLQRKSEIATINKHLRVREKLIPIREVLK
ncbi:site-specific integrase [Vibrio diabolicus]|uniref:site-specific integrase n=1 Tax=Vibrio diabolicus TaxID=50719 RepID=UPI00211AFC4C|nr:site-specific integrase [Vibrio diabolicus]